MPRPTLSYILNPCSASTSRPQRQPHVRRRPRFNLYGSLVAAAADGTDSDSDPQLPAYEPPQQRQRAHTSLGNTPHADRDSAPRGPPPPYEYQLQTRYDYDYVGSRAESQAQTQAHAHTRCRPQPVRPSERWSVGVSAPPPPPGSNPIPIWIPIRGQSRNRSRQQRNTLDNDNIGVGADGGVHPRPGNHHSLQNENENENDLENQMQNNQPLTREEYRSVVKVLERALQQITQELTETIRAKRELREENDMLSGENEILRAEWEEVRVVLPVGVLPAVQIGFSPRLIYHF